MTGIKAQIIEKKNREHPIVFWQIAKKKVIYIIYLSIYFNLKKFKHFYLSIKCIKKVTLYPKIQYTAQW